MNNFLHWWQNLPGQINPVVFKIGMFKVQYYGLMYVVAFAIIYYLVLYRLNHEKEFEVSLQDIQSLTTSMILGLILGGRLGYVVLYNFSYYLNHPLEIFLPFEFSSGITFTGISGMSYHGGVIGIIIAAWIYIRKNKLDFLLLADLYVPVIPLGYTFGRIGNFINKELYGRVTSSSMGMFFPNAPGDKLRHPSQLYEAFFEGIVLFLILWSCRRINKLRGKMLSLYLIGYGFFRFFIEFYREPDAHLGFVFLSLSMGQILCFSMILAGVILLYPSFHRSRSSLVLKKGIKNN